MTKTTIEIPQNIDSNSLFDVWLLKSICDFLILKNEYEIIQYRFGLNGYPSLTLEDTGIILDLTRERVRQVEQRTVNDLSRLTNGDISRNMRLRKDLVERLQSYKSSLYQLGQIIDEQSVTNHAIDFFSEVNINLPLLRLLLFLLGYKSIDLATNALGHHFAWALKSVDTKKIQSAISVISSYLREVAIAKSFDEIKLAVNKDRKAELRFSDYELKQAVNLSLDLEKLDSDKFQIRYEKLSSIGDKAYRILYNTNEPLHVRQLAIILNKESFKHGETSRITSHHIGARLSSDSRFGSIGRSGEWFLVEWERFTTDFILELMEDALHSRGEPLSAKAIFDFVREKRPVEKGAIDSYLGQDSRFVRVGIDQFALRDWGLASVSTTRERKVERVFSKAKLCEYIELVFKAKQVNEIFLVDLSQEIGNLEPRVSPQSIYNSIIKSPAVNIINQQQERMRKIAVFVPNYRAKLTKLDILTKDIPVGELIQTTIRKILESQTDNQLELVTLRNLVSKEIYCPPASVYSSIDKMDDVEKITNSSNQMVCRLIKSTNNYAKQIEQIADKLLVVEINRAISLVNINSVDLALFQMGKIFEHTLKKYMLEVQSKNSATVTQDDLSKLYKMVQWAGKTGLVTDETALQYLRIERNDRGHGAPAERDEREALLKNAPTLIQFYIDYIVLLEQRREKLV